MATVGFHHVGAMDSRRIWGAAVGAGWLWLIDAGFYAGCRVVELPDGTLCATPALELAAADLEIAQHIGNHVAMAAEHHGAAGERAYVFDGTRSRRSLEELGRDLYGHLKPFREWFDGLHTT